MRACAIGLLEKCVMVRHVRHASSVDGVNMAGIARKKQSPPLNFDTYALRPASWVGLRARAAGRRRGWGGFVRGLVVKGDFRCGNRVRKLAVMGLLSTGRRCE